MITFVTPTYNHRNCIQRCIISVQNQTVPCEQIIVDDGSTDGTGEIASAYVTKHIRYIKQEHKGVSRLAETYNLAVKMASGDFIAVLEGDDYIVPERAEVQEEELEKYPVSWGKVKTVDTSDKLLCEQPINPEQYVDMPKNEFIKKMLFDNRIGSVSVAIRKSALESVGGFIQGDYYVDYPTWLALLSKYNFGFVNKTLAYYMTHEDSVSAINRKSTRVWLDAFRAYDKYPSLRVISKPELYAYWLKWRLWRWIWIFRVEHGIFATKGNYQSKAIKDGN